jgi:hypothetical protein
MTPNAVAFYAVAVLIVLAAGAAVGLPSLRHAGYAGAAVIVLLAALELISGAYALAVVQLVVPGIAVAIVVLVIRHDAYRGLITTPTIPARLWIAAPIAVGIGAVLVATLALVGSGWYPGDLPILLINRYPTVAALVTVLHYREPYALAIVVLLVVVTVGTSLVIGRRSSDEVTLDQRTQQRREREELARRRREDRQQGRRPARDDS